MSHLYDCPHPFYVETEAGPICARCGTPEGPSPRAATVPTDYTEPPDMGTALLRAAAANASTEQIVRALAAADPVAYDGDRFDGDYACTLCRERDSHGSGDLSHEPDCPWRQAVEWVAAQAAQPFGATMDELRACPHGVLPAACPFCVKRQEAAAKPVPSWVDEAEAALARAAASGQDVEAARRVSVAMRVLAAVACLTPAALVLGHGWPEGVTGTLERMVLGTFVQVLMCFLALLLVAFSFEDGAARGGQ